MPIGRLYSESDPAFADPDPILDFAINGTRYVAFPREQALALCHWVIDTCEEAIAVPEHVAAKAKSITSSRVAPTSFSNGADPGSGDGVAAVPASPPGSFQVPAKKPRAAKKVWPVMPDKGFLKQPPRADSFAAAVLDVIKEADSEGLDVAGIIQAFEDKGVSIEGEDVEKMVANSIHQTLVPRGCIERVERQDRQVFWRCADAE